MANGECQTAVARPKGTVVTLFDMQILVAFTLQENEYTNFESLSEGSWLVSSYERHRQSQEI